MKVAFVLVKCELGQVEKVANQIIEIDGISEVHSVTGPWDLLVKAYAPVYDGFGELIPGKLQKVPGVRDTETLLAFRAFGAAD